MKEKERCLLSLFLSLDNSEASSGPGWDLLPQTPVPLVYYYMLNARGLWAFKSDDDESASGRGNTWIPTSHLQYRVSPEKSGFPTKVKTLVREKNPTECCKYAPMLPSNSSFLALIFSSYLLNNTGGEKEGRKRRREGAKKVGRKEGRKKGDGWKRKQAYTGWLWLWIQD